MIGPVDPPRIDLWLTRSEAIEEEQPGEYWAILSENEKRRALAFMFRKDANLFIQSHGFLRKVLASYCSSAAESLMFSENDNGKPFLVGGPEGLHFNMSHSGGCTLVGVTYGSACGVDIERIREDVSAVDIAARFFSPEENRRLAGLSTGEAVFVFFRMWTAKEAILKAAGTGLSFPLRDFSVGGDGLSSVARVPMADGPKDFWYTNLDLVPGFHAAAAVEGSAGHVRLCNSSQMSRNVL